MPSAGSRGCTRGKTRTYDLRGRKVAVVMAGNPYTESGEKFTIPDMLANRADTYNLGDIIGEHADAFKMSYLENCLTSNPTLNTLAARSQQDVYAIIQIAETGSREGIDFEGSYSAQEVEEMADVMRKLIVVRDVILTREPAVHRLGRAGRRVPHRAAVPAAGLVPQHEPDRREGRAGDERRGIDGPHRRDVRAGRADADDRGRGEPAQVQVR